MTALTLASSLFFLATMIVVGGACWALILKRPEFLLYYYVFCEFSGFDISTPLFQLRVVLIIVLLAYHVSRRVVRPIQDDSGSLPGLRGGYWWFMWPVACFAVWALSVDAFFMPDLPQFFRLVGRFYSKVAFIFLLVYFFQELVCDKWRLKSVSLVIIAGSALSSLVAVFQWLGSDFFLGIGGWSQKGSEVFRYWADQGRFAGFFIQPLELSLSILLSFFVLIGILSRKNALFLVPAGVMLLGGLYSTGTRMALAGILSGAFFILVQVWHGSDVFRKRVLGVAVVSLIIGGGLFTAAFLSHSDLWVDIKENNFFRIMGLDEEIQGRVEIAKPSFLNIVENPLGISRHPEKFWEEIGGFIPLVAGRFQRSASMNTSHNQFLTVGAFWGVPAILFLLILYWRLLKIDISISRKGKDWSSRGLPIAFTGYLVGYITYGVLHNMYPIGDITFGIFLGLNLAVLRLAERGAAYSNA